MDQDPVQNSPALSATAFSDSPPNVNSRIKSSTGKLWLKGCPENIARPHRTAAAPHPLRRRWFVLVDLVDDEKTSTVKPAAAAAPEKVEKEFNKESSKEETYVKHERGKESPKVKCSLKATSQNSGGSSSC